MIVKDYIKMKFQTFGIQMSEADLFDIAVDDMDVEITADNKQSVEVAMAGFIPQLLLRPTSVSEKGFSMSFDPEALKDYYSLLCKKYGLENLLGSSISDGSHLW